MISPSSETACPSERILSHHVHESAITYSPNASSLIRCVTYIMGDKRVMYKYATTGRLCVVHALRPFPVRARAGLNKSPKRPSCPWVMPCQQHTIDHHWDHQFTMPRVLRRMQESKHVRRRSGKSSSFGFSQVEMHGALWVNYRKTTFH